MKNIFFRYFMGCMLCFLGTLFYTSCNDLDLNGRTEPQITMNDQMVAGPLGKREVLYLTSSYPWFAEPSDNWIKITRNRGQALKADSLVIDVEANEGQEDREGYIEIRLMDQLTKRVAVKQAGRSSLITLSKQFAYYNINGGEWTIDVVTSREWDFEKPSVNWVTVAKVGNDKLKVTVTEKNNTGAERSVKMKLFDVDHTPGVEETLTIVQTNFDKMLSVSPDKKNLILAKDGGDVKIPVTLNVDYELETSADWLKVIKGPEVEEGMLQNIELSGTLSPNLGREERSGYIVVKNKGTLELSDTVYISQRVASRIIYVKPGGTGDGSSWERAFGSFVDGNAAAGSNDELWVAAGEYKLKATLNLSKTNIYGGFSGNETSIYQRDLTKKSILVGGDFQMITYWGETAKRGIEYYIDGFVFTGVNSKLETNPFEIYGTRVLRNCIFRDNTYGKNGGGYFTQCVLINCLFYNNTTTAWSSVIQTISCDLYNVTIVNNKGLNTASGGGLRAKDTKLYNTILWGNKQNSKPFQVYLDAAGSTFTNCAVEGGYSFNNAPGSTTGSITLDADNLGSNGPKFINTSTGGENFSLQAGSACIDKGSVSVLNGINIYGDIVGNDRISGNGIDIGAYEFNKK